MKNLSLYIYNTLVPLFVCFSLTSVAFAKDFDVLKEDYSYQLYKYVFEKGVVDAPFFGYRELEIQDVKNNDVETAELDMLCYRSDFSQRKSPVLGYAMISNVRANDLHRDFGPDVQSKLLRSPLFYVVAATEVVKSGDLEHIFDSPGDKFRSIPLELIDLAEEANRQAFSDLTYRTNLNYRSMDNKIYLHWAYGAGTGEPYGLNGGSADIPLEIELHQFLEKVFSYGKHTVNGWAPENKDLNNPKGLYYKLPNLVAGSSLETNLIRHSGMHTSQTVYAGKEFKLKRLANNKYVLRIRHFHSELNFDQLSLMTLFTFKKRFVEMPFVDEYCIQR